MTNKITRVRTGCWTCKKRDGDTNYPDRHRKCDETKPICNNCSRSNRHCEGYEMRLSFEIVLSSSNLDSRGRKLSKSRNKRTESSNSDNNEGSNKRSRTSSSSGDKGFVIANGKLNNKTNSSIREEQALTVSSTTISTTPKVENNISIPTTSANHFHNAWFEDLETLFSSTVDFGNLSNHNNPHPQNGSLIANIFNLGSHYDEFVDPSPEEKNQWETKKRELSNVTTPASPNTLTDIETDNNNTNTGNTPRSITSVPLMNNDSLLILSHEEENILLKHFFKKLLPLLDGHPSSPWPDLALKYCDFNVARSCFISLASMHMYECREGGEKFYETGVRHINSTMNHLIQYINETISKMKLDDGSHDLSKEDLAKTYSSSFVILVLINVNVLFLVLEKGKSAMARYFFEVFGTICQDPGFYDYVLTNNDKKRSLCVALSWYDTVAAVVSPDCRLPCTMPEWYGNVSDSISTAKIMGCPGEVFIAMSEVCLLRHEKHNGANLSTPSYMKRYEDIKSQLIRYRDYVPFESDEGEEPYVNRMKCASCWALAVLITLNKVVAPPDFQEFNNKIASEFIMTYGSMESKSPLVTQMVWPVYAIACECKTEDERTALLIYMETLYETAQMGTLYSLKEIVLNVWERGMTQEDYLREWLEDGIDYLPV